MTDEVRASDIDDLKNEDRNLHQRITRNSDQSREDNQRIIDKMEELQRSINQMTAPLAEMATQVGTNSQDLATIKMSQIDVLAEKVRENTQNRITWNKRAWAIVVMMIAELIGLVYALQQGGS